MSPDIAKNLRQILLFFLLSKGLVWGAMIFAFYGFTYHQENHFGNKYYPYSAQISLRHIFQTWDTNHYLYLAEKGYSSPFLRESLSQEIERHQRLLYYRKIEFLESQKNFSSAQQLQSSQIWADYEKKQQFLIYQLQKKERDILNSDAFPPAYPFLIAGVTFVTSCTSLVAAFFISNLFSFGVMILFFLLIADEEGTAVARCAVYSWMLYPYSFVFHIPYTESLFLFVVLLGFYSFRKQAFWLSACCFGLLPLIRVLGILILVPYGVALFKQKRSLFFLLFPLGGFICYLVTMFWFTGDPWIGFKAQEGFISKHSGLRLFQLGEWFRFTFLEWDFSYGFHPQQGSLDRVSFLLFLLWLLLAGSHLKKEWLFYILCYGAFPAFTSLGLMSYSRYVVSVFPLFLWLGKVLEKRPKTKTLFFIVGISGQIALAGRMGLNYWVA